ncbi:MAG: hypothetical protein HYW52_04160 [Gemmatimonadetes bacterium]|nr:hypothetical protein [Gemmatimonadota bacterium]
MSPTAGPSPAEGPVIYVGGREASPAMSTMPPSPDPRIGLKHGLMDAGEAIWNLRVLSKTPSPPGFLGVTNSDLAFLGHYALQGNYNGFQVWDISNPAAPALKKAYLCPASQSDVSVYQNLLFVSAEAPSARLDCSTEGVRDTVSHDRIRGIRIFDITDISDPKYIGNVQTCRGSHTHSVLVDPKDPENVYIYISGSAGVRSPNELPGCSRLWPDEDPNSALFRIEVIKVPLGAPEQAAIVSSPRIFQDLAPVPRHGEAPEDIAARKAAVDSVGRAGGFITTIGTDEIILGPGFVNPRLDSIVRARGGSGAPTGGDSAALRDALPGIIAAMRGEDANRPPSGPNQCHDITLYPEIGLAGGACGGYGLLLDIRDPANPVRIDAVADSNFAYWHSATFNNDGTKILFTDEWGGGGAPKCRVTDKYEWGADAIFTLANHRMTFRSYYKIPAPQTPLENCVAHNGSLIPIPGRDIMVQGWYQGGISVFDWTDAAHPQEIAFHDRGPVDSTRMRMAGSWSVYWYNGLIVSSEIARGLDIFELTPSAFISQNEIDAAKTVRFDYFNTQGQQRFVWPPGFALARAYLDQLERSNGLASERIAAARTALTAAERAKGEKRRTALTTLATQLNSDASAAADRPKVLTLAGAVTDLASAQR